MNRAEYNKENKICRKIFSANSLCTIRFIFSFFFFSQLSFASVATDTTKQQYALNDPRNPNCPCHKYQKMAEDEYKRSHPGNNTSKVNETNENTNTTNVNSQKIPVDRVNKNSEISFNRLKRKSVINWIIKCKRWLIFKHSKIKKYRPNYSVCFKW
jgi:hypothetical protein